MIKNIAETLDDLSFEPLTIYETIVTTKDVKEKCNAAPMGIIREGPEEIRIMPFNTSKTYKNLKQRFEGCINITSKTGSFLVTAFKEVSFENLEKPRIDEKLRLQPSDAHIFVNVIGFENITDLRSSFSCTVKEIEVINPFPTPYSRGKAKAIDAIIHATRIKVYNEKRNNQMLKELTRKFIECKEFVLQTSSPTSEERKVIFYLDELIKNDFKLKDRYMNISLE